jgi:hypothetical protein
MNKLLFPNGGCPVYGDDFIFLDTAQRDTFKAVLFEVSTIYNGYLILGGCGITIAGANFTVAPGYLLVDYEICRFDGGTYSTAGGIDGSFAFSVSNDSGGLKTFANGSTQNTWQIRKVVFNAGLPAGGPLDYAELSNYSDGIEALLNQKVTSSNSFSMINGWSKSVSEPPVLYKHLKQVNLNGELVPGTMLVNSWTKITTLPVGFRPIKRFKSVQAAYQSTMFGNCIIDVFTNGEVYAAATSTTVWDLVSLDLSYIAS